MMAPRTWAIGLATACSLVPFSLSAQTNRSKSENEPIICRLAEAQLAVSASPDGRRFVCSGQNRAIRQWRLDGTELAPLQNAPGGWSIQYSPDGRLLVGCGLDRLIRMWDVETGHEIRQLQGHTQIAWMASFFPDGERLISVGEDATIRLWNVSTGTEIGQITGHPGPIWCMALAKDGNWLVTGAADGTMRLWDVAAQKMIRRLDGVHGGGVGALCFSPDTRMIASTGWQDHKVFLWETGTGRCRRQIPHEGGSKFVLFTSDNRTLVTAGNDRTIRFWHLQSGTQTSPLEGHTGTVNGLAMTPDGRFLVSASNDQTVRIWDLSQRRLTATARILPNRQVESCWHALAHPDGKTAYEAMTTLAGAPEQTVALIRARIQPASAAHAGRIAELIALTNHPRYTVREQATQELEKLRDQAETALRQALARPEAETRRRAERLLRKLETSGISSETLRAIRCVELLEQLGTPEAQKVLQDLAQGASDARLTQEAKASLQRLRPTLASR
jgi:WD40 repeat protein